MFDDFDLSDFWEDSEYARESYVGEELTDLLLASVEKELGYRLPRAFVALMKTQNGGIPKLTNHPTAAAPTSWAEDHVAIHGIHGVGRSKRHSLCGDAGSRFWIEEWEYPPIGVYFADCPSAGHDMIALDYRACGPSGEPLVVHVDQGHDYKVTTLAEDFERFVRGLRGDDAFPL